MPTQSLEYNATLVERPTITPQLAIFRVHPDEPEYPLVAGQYTLLGLKRGEARLAGSEVETGDEENPVEMVRRPYSICSATDRTDSLEFYISLLNSGEFTPRLFNLQPGARLYLGPKARGKFTLRELSPDNNVPLVATGVGLGPYLSILRSYASDFPAPSVGEIQGRRHSWDLGYGQ